VLKNEKVCELNFQRKQGEEPRWGL